MDDKIERAKRVLLTDLKPNADHTFGASVYVMMADGTYEWVQIPGPLTTAGAADLVRDLSRRDDKAQFQVSMSDTAGRSAAEWRAAAWRKLETALTERRVFLKPVEPQRF